MSSHLLTINCLTLTFLSIMIKISATTRPSTAKNVFIPSGSLERVSEDMSCLFIGQSIPVSSNIAQSFIVSINTIPFVFSNNDGNEDIRSNCSPLFSIFQIATTTKDFSYFRDNFTSGISTENLFFVSCFCRGLSIKDGNL